MTESSVRVGISEEYLETSKLINDWGEVHREGTFTGSPTNEDAKQEVDETSQAARVALYGADGHPVSVESVGDSHALLVHNEDIDVTLVNQLAHEHTATNTTPTAAIAAGDTGFTLTSATGFAIGNRLLITENTNTEDHLPEITNLVVAVVTLDGPIDVAYTTAATITKVVTDMAVSGSLASPVSYIVRPHSSVIWHLTRLNFTMTHGTQGTDDAFGDLTALANGVVVRQKVNGVYTTMTNWKANQVFKEDMYDVTYTDKAGPSLFGTSGRWSYRQRTHTVIRLDGSTSDELEVLIQDNLTGLTSFNINLQGHVDEIAG